jgi:hypothetical protein
MSLLNIPDDALRVLFHFPDDKTLKSVSETHSRLYRLVMDELLLNRARERIYACSPCKLIEGRFFRTVTVLELYKVPNSEAIQDVLHSNYATQLKCVRILEQKARNDGRGPTMLGGVLEAICDLPKLEKLELHNVVITKTFEAFSKLPSCLLLDNVYIDVSKLTHLQSLDIRWSPKLTQAIFELDPTQYTQLHTLCYDNSKPSMESEEEYAFLNEFPSLKKIIHLPGYQREVNRIGARWSFIAINAALKNHAFISLQNERGDTLLSLVAQTLACRSNNQDKIRMDFKDYDEFIGRDEGIPETRAKYLELLSSGASFSLEILIKPLAYACVSGDVEIVHQLIKLKAPVNPEQPTILSPLEWAVQAFGYCENDAAKKRYLEVIDILLQEKANPNVDNGFGPPLSHAVLSCSADLVKKLLNAPIPANPNLSGMTGAYFGTSEEFTPLDALDIVSGHDTTKFPEIREMLLEKGAISLQEEKRKERAKEHVIEHIKKWLINEQLKG